MSKAKMEAARELIREKHYNEARAILQTVDHPVAKEWIAKIDTLNPPPKPAKVSALPVQHRTSSQGDEELNQRVRRNLIVIGILVLIVALVVGGRWYSEWRYVEDYYPTAVRYVQNVCDISRLLDADRCTPNLPRTRSGIDSVVLCRDLAAKNNWQTRETRYCLFSVID